MRNQNKSKTILLLLAGALLLFGGLMFSLPGVVLAQTTPTATTEGYPGPGTATATTEGYPGPGTATATVTVTPTVTGTVTVTGTPPTATATPRVLIPATGGDLSAPRPLINVNSGVFVALWLVGLLLIGYGLISRSEK